MKIYTKTGDDGTTGLQGNVRVKKSSPRIIAYGAVDEANAALGIVLSYELEPELTKHLTQIQNELFVVGADLSNPDQNNLKNRVTSEMVKNLEKTIDAFENELEPLRNFILPGGNIVASHLHLVRTIVRRAESCVVIAKQTEKINDNCLQYLNRLSDLLFVLARVINKRKGKKDMVWKS